MTTIIRESSGPADEELVSIHACNASERPDMTLYEVPDGWGGDTDEEVVRDGVFIGLYQIEWRA